MKDKHCSEMNFRIGDRVWLFNPAVRVGQAKKFSSMWRGPYTVIDRVSPVNYRIQLIGTTSTQIVHHNRLKLCHGDPEKSRGSEQTNQLERDEVLLSAKDPSPDMVLGYECPGGYVCTDADDETMTQEQPVHHRPQRDRHPPLIWTLLYTLNIHPGI